jgi:hypothetical protein
MAGPHGDVATITARNALLVSEADVQNGTTCRVDGVTYTVVSASSTSGASCWSPRNNMAATAAPAVTDDTDLGYKVGSSWWDTTNDILYKCLDASDGAAVWQAHPKVGTWAGAVVDGTNVASSGDCSGFYMRLGTRVFLWGNIASIDPTAGAPTATDFTVALPIASNFAATTDAGGVANGTDFTGNVTAVIADDVLKVDGQFRANTTTDVGIVAYYSII